jgi:phenylalanyl-tRNA synthetase alpha chain
MPPVARDLSLMVQQDMSKEEIGDRVRLALGDREQAVEAVEVRSETPYGDLPSQAIARMGAKPGQKNILLRIVLRDLERTLTQLEANVLRDAVYHALHAGDQQELAVPSRAD